MCCVCVCVSLSLRRPIELFFPTKREQQRFKWQPKNVSEQPPPLPPRAATIYLITSTRPHNTQKLDLTSLCQTLMHVPDLVWIVVEASTVKSKSVGKVLERCQVPSIHLNVPEHSNLIEQRNAGLNFLTTEFCNVERCHGVVCFGNEGTKYDLRLFSEVWDVWCVSIQMVQYTRVCVCVGVYMCVPAVCVVMWFCTTA